MKVDFIGLFGFLLLGIHLGYRFAEYDEQEDPEYYEVEQ